VSAGQTWRVAAAKAPLATTQRSRLADLIGAVGSEEVKAGDACRLPRSQVLSEHQLDQLGLEVGESGGIAVGEVNVLESA
jgi:hypothetical protein